MFCQKCGKQNDDNATHCAACGEPLVQIQQPAPKKKKKHPIALFVGIGVVVFVGAMIAIGNGVEDPSTGKQSDQNEPIIAGKSASQTGDIGKYNVTIKDSKVVRNNDEDILIVTYTFKNNSDDSKAFIYAVTDKLFQNGVELGTVYTSFGIEDEYDFDNKSKEIKPGVSLDVQAAYELNDTTSDVEVEISEWISFNDDKITYTIKLAE